MVVNWAHKYVHTYICTHVSILVTHYEFLLILWKSFTVIELRMFSSAKQKIWYGKKL